MTVFFPLPLTTTSPPILLTPPAWFQPLRLCEVKIWFLTLLFQIRSLYRYAEVEPGAMTVVGIVGPAATVDQVTGHLRTL
jgi:hypothetical protein